jgi:uncharacterized protein
MKHLKITTDSNEMYVFNGLTNDIIQIDSPNIFDSIDNRDNFGEVNIVRNFSPSALSDLQRRITSEAKTLMIEITEQCNLRCTYCVYDEGYSSNRDHGLSSISEETAKNAINNFKQRAGGENAYIVFYGGEPLLEYEMIKTLTEYANTIFENKVHFSLTTNATKLSSEKIDFLIKHDFLITISIDGDKTIHDTYRISSSGSGTFDKIMSNISIIKNQNEPYFHNKININCVINEADDIDSLNSFFISNQFNLNNVRFSQQIQKSTELNAKTTNKFTKNYILDLIRNRKLKNSPVEYHYFSSLIRKIIYREIKEESYKASPKCTPFSNRTFVRTNGKVQFCERIEDIGISESDTETLVNTATIFQKQYFDFVKSNCENCFAFNFCEMCYASFVKNNQLDSQIFQNKCETFRNDIKLSLEVYIELMENNEEELMEAECF